MAAVTTAFSASLRLCKQRRAAAVGWLVMVWLWQKAGKLHESYGEGTNYIYYIYMFNYYNGTTRLQKATVKQQCRRWDLGLVKMTMFLLPSSFSGKLLRFPHLPTMSVSSLEEGGRDC